ncbi:MAG: transposase [Rickettsiales endosymbiont of Dermacentor nuttalli]
MHTIVDDLGYPIKFILTVGQLNEITQAKNLIENIENMAIMADKAYDSNGFIKLLQNKNCLLIIHSKKNILIQRHYNQGLYKELHLIECFLEK